MISTNIDYPSQLPWPLREGYDINHVSPFVRTTMADGRALQRRRFSSVPTMVNVSWIFNSDTEVGYFELWFKQRLKDGVEWFNCPLKTPVGEKQYVCRFTEMYRGPRPVGLCAWQITASLEIFERPLLPPEWIDFPDFLIGSDIIDIAMNRNWPEA